MTMELATLSEVMTLGDVLAKSGFFQDARGAAQAVVKVLAGRELGFGPIASMTGVHIVKGKPVMLAMLIAAAIKRSGKYDYKVREFSDKVCKLEFFERAGISLANVPSSQWISIGESSFSADDASKAGLGGDNWRHYPKNMLFARAISNGGKWYTPDIFGGPVYTPDELGIDVDGATGEVKNLSSVTVEQTTTGAAAPKGGPPQPTAQPSSGVVAHELRQDAPSPGTMDPDAAPLVTESENLFRVPQEIAEREALEKRITKFTESKITLTAHRAMNYDGEWRKLDLAMLHTLANLLDGKR